MRKRRKLLRAFFLWGAKYTPRYCDYWMVTGCASISASGAIFKPAT
ncbi:hypothetical protein R69888_00760 [Paraburkholderia haematera]|uniref:Uncharacterized protein n=1 Tax=Paraburkholderia haematera TaxID=2793077 RepID=A0ABM8QK00_9BURK|nr:hypothetical protein R69888_00760 [Paraburkholderia haematera]